MQRAVLTAPVARALDTEPGFAGVNLYKLPGATNGTVQAWSTPNGDDPRLAADPALTLYLTWGAVPAVLKKFLILVLRWDDAALTLGVKYLRVADLGAADYVRFWSTLTGTAAVPGPLTAKLASTKLVSDRYYRPDATPSQAWLGVDDSSLGDMN